MLIFNTTYKVATDVYDEWLKWINEYHIPFMLGSGSFSHPQVARVIGSDDEQGGSYSVQFQIVDMNELKTWHKNNAVEFQNRCYENFGSNVIFFTTVLELID